MCNGPTVTWVLAHCAYQLKTTALTLLAVSHHVAHDGHVSPRHPHAHVCLRQEALHVEADVDAHLIMPAMRRTRVRHLAADSRVKISNCCVSGGVSFTHESEGTPFRPIRTFTPQDDTKHRSIRVRRKNHSIQRVSSKSRDSWIFSPGEFRLHRSMQSHITGSK